MLQGMLLDYDGTIAPTTIRQQKWFEFYGNVHGKDIGWEDLDSFLDFYNPLCAQDGGVQNVYDALGLPCDMNDKQHPVWPAFHQFNEENPAGLYEGMKETLQALWEMGHLQKKGVNRRIRMGINSSNTWRSMYGDLLDNDLLQHFDCYVTEETLREKYGAEGVNDRKKPAKYSVELALQLLDTEAQYTLHVGDTRHDLAASVNIISKGSPQALITVGACYGYEGRERLEAGVVTNDGHLHFDYLIDSPKELIPIVQSLL